MVSEKEQEAGVSDEIHLLIMQVMAISSVLLLAVAVSLGWRMLRSGNAARRLTAQSQAGREAFALSSVAKSRQSNQLAELDEMVSSLMAGNRWDVLSDIMGQLAADAILCSDGERLHSHVTQIALRPVRSAGQELRRRGRANDFRPLEAALAPYRKAARVSGGRTEITALAALACVEAAWAAHGASRGGDTRQGLERFRQLMQEAAYWVDFAMRKPAHSIYLAEAHYMSSFAETDPARALAERFEIWRAVDPTDLKPYVERTRHLLPSWYGSAEAIATLADEAVTATWSELGQGAYAYVLRAARQGIAPASIPGYTPEREAIAVVDAVAQIGTQSAANEWAAWAVSVGHEELAVTLMRRYLRKVHLDKWDPADDYAQMYALYHRAFGRKPEAGEDRSPALA